MIKEFTEKLKLNFTENGALNIVCLGDSVTQGCFTFNFRDPALAYPEKLRAMLNLFYPNRIFNLINSGIGGTTAKFATGRFERDVLKYNPDLVLIMFGVNDFGDIDAYIASLKEMFIKLKEKGIPCVYITEHTMNTKMTSAVFESDLEYARVTLKKQTDGTMDKLFEAGKEVARQCGVPICDMYEKWKTLAQIGVDTTALLANGINHPIPEMNNILAFELLRIILF